MVFCTTTVAADQACKKFVRRCGLVTMDEAGSSRLRMAEIWLDEENQDCMLTGDDAQLPSTSPGFLSYGQGQGRPTRQCLLVHSYGIHYSTTHILKLACLLSTRTIATAIAIDKWTKTLNKDGFVACANEASQRASSIDSV